MDTRWLLRPLAVLISLEAAFWGLVFLQLGVFGLLLGLGIVGIAAASIYQNVVSGVHSSRMMVGQAVVVVLLGMLFLQFGELSAALLFLGPGLAYLLLRAAELVPRDWSLPEPPETDTDTRQDGTAPPDTEVYTPNDSDRAGGSARGETAVYGRPDAANGRTEIADAGRGPTCPRCGGAVLPEHDYCGNCGEKL